MISLPGSLMVKHWVRKLGDGSSIPHRVEILFQIENKLQQFGVSILNHRRDVLYGKEIKFLMWRMHVLSFTEYLSFILPFILSRHQFSPRLAANFIQCLLSTAFLPFEKYWNDLSIPKITYLRSIWKVINWETKERMSPSGFL